MRDTLKSSVDRVEVWMRQNMATELEHTLKVPAASIRDLAARVVLDFPDATGTQIAMAVYDLSVDVGAAHLFNSEQERVDASSERAKAPTFGMPDRAAFDALPPTERLNRAYQAEADQRRNLQAEQQKASDALASARLRALGTNPTPEQRLLVSNEAAAFLRAKREKADA